MRKRERPVWFCATWGISEERLMEMIRKLIAPEESNVLTGQWAGYTPRATRMLEGAVEEADDLRSEKIGTEHLLLGDAAGS